jgi:hypothetical protein
MKGWVVGEAEVYQMNDINGMVWNAGRDAPFGFIGEFLSLPARQEG